MVYVILAFGGILGIFWAAGLLFASKTKGDRSLIIPVVHLMIFIGITGFGGMKWSEANANPAKISKENYLALKKGMSLNDVKNGLDFIDPVQMKGLSKEQLEQYDLTSNRIRMPGDLMGRLSPGVYFAERKNAKIAVTIDGAASKIGAKNISFKNEGGPTALLGSTSTIDAKKKRGHGLKGAKIRVYILDEAKLETEKAKRKALREENAENKKFVMPHLIPEALDGQEWIFEEGKDWTYEDSQTAAQVAKNLATVISGHDYFTAVYEEDEDALEASTKFVISLTKCVKGKAPSGVKVRQDDPCSKEGGFTNPHSGKGSNQLRIQVSTGDNLAIQVGLSTKGDTQRFFGGADEVSLSFWQEEDPFFDDDFSTSARLIVGGFLNGELYALGQNGLEVTKEEEPIQLKKSN
jgi:hypothetical protein